MPLPSSEKSAASRSWHPIYAGAVMAVLVWAVWVGCQLRPGVWVALAIGQANKPFLDLYGLLASNDAYWAGINPYVPFDLDPLQRPFLYGEWWFVLGWLGIGREDNVWLGFLLGALVLVTSLFMARPRWRREWVYLCVLLVSPAWLLSFTRANNDPVMLVLMSLGLCCWRSERWPQRSLGILLFASCVALKYYPLVTLVVLLDSRHRRAGGASLALYFAVLVVSWPFLEVGLTAAAHYTPTPSWFYAFGAPMLLRNLEMESRLAWLLPAAVLGVWALALTWRHRRAGTPSLSGAAAADEREFLCGASLLVGLFFLGASFTYKLIFAVWMLPWLWRMATSTGPERPWARLALGLLLGVACTDGWGAVGINFWRMRWPFPAAMVALKVVLTVTQLLSWGLMIALLRLLPVVAGPRLFRLWSGDTDRRTRVENELPAVAR